MPVRNRGPTTDLVFAFKQGQNEEAPQLWESILALNVITMTNLKWLQNR